jgi:zinc D-Ala-D-Ala carboxypeptidase
MDRRFFLQSILFATSFATLYASTSSEYIDFAKDALENCAYDPLVEYGSDIYISKEELTIAKTLFVRLKRVQNTIGYGNFNIVSFDEAIKVAKNYSKVGSFSPAELLLFEKYFYFNARNYGFYGDKVVEELTRSFPSNEMVKIPHSGHFLSQGDPLKHYQTIRQCIGDTIILTSGVRSVVKQMYLFLNKAFALSGNLSQASASLAPAGYSYHGIGDFDVGKVGFGYRNFTEDFEHTDEFKRLMDLGFVAIRYPQKNPFGVRYEPWHIKVI